MRAGERYNEGPYGATSSMTAVLGRLATYSGKVVTWDEAIQHTAKRFKDIQAKYGRKSIGGITSSRCTNEEVYVVQKLVRAAFGIVGNDVPRCEGPAAVAGFKPDDPLDVGISARPEVGPVLNTRVPTTSSSNSRWARLCRSGSGGA